MQRCPDATAHPAEEMPYNRGYQCSDAEALAERSVPRAHLDPCTWHSKPTLDHAHALQPGHQHTIIHAVQWPVLCSRIGLALPEACKVNSALGIFYHGSLRQESPSCGYSHYAQ